MRTRFYAILSDIHANYQALEAVARDAINVAEKEKADHPHFIVLGDVVDYGPQPNECMNWVEQNADIVVQGNHDIEATESIYQRPDPDRVGPNWWPITIWTRMELQKGYKAAIKQWTRYVNKRSKRLPTELGNMVFFHASLTGRGWEYIKEPWEGWQNINKLQEDIDYGFFGHTHFQGYFVDDISPWMQGGNSKNATAHQITTDISPFSTIIRDPCLKQVSLMKDKQCDTSYTQWSELPKYKTLFNPGSVGQPRSYPHDNRAAYMMLKSNGQIQFQFRRVPYDFKKTIQLLQEKVFWPPVDYAQKQGSDILREVGPNPYTREKWEQLMSDYRYTIHSMPEKLPPTVALLVRYLDEYPS